MIVEHAEISPGVTAFRSFALGLTTTKKQKPWRGFPSLATDIATHRLSQGIAGDLKSDEARRKPDTSGIETPNQDLDYAALGQPSADIITSNGDKYCSLGQLSRSSGCDYGVANHLVRRGSIKPDNTIAGAPVWSFGKSANYAHAKLSVAKDMK